MGSLRMGSCKNRKLANLEYCRFSPWRAAGARGARRRARQGPRLAEALCAMARLTYASRLPARNAQMSGPISAWSAHLGLANAVVFAGCHISAEVCARQDCPPADTLVTT